jgi:long-chain acyl-CoA synthetase
VGDRGLLEDGVLTVVGRGSAAVTTGGTTVPIAEVEAVLRPRVRGEVLVVGVPHGTLGQVVAAVLTDPGDLSAARTAARELLEPARRPRVWFHVAELPVTGAGKTDRARIGAMVARPGVVRLAGPGTGPGVGAR